MTENPCLWKIAVWLSTYLHLGSLIILNTLSPISLLSYKNRTFHNPIIDIIFSFAFSYEHVFSSTECNISEKKKSLDSI